MLKVARLSEYVSYAFYQLSFHPFETLLCEEGIPSIGIGTDNMIAVSTTLSQLDVLHRLTALYPDVFSASALNSSSTLAAFRKDHHLVSPIGVEGLHQIGNSFSNLRLYHSLGVKYATLTHNCNNAFADAALTTGPSGETVVGPAYWNGLSDRGQLVVQEMNSKTQFLSRFP